MKQLEECRQQMTGLQREQLESIAELSKLKLELERFTLNPISSPIYINLPVSCISLPVHYIARCISLHLAEV